MKNKISGAGVDLRRTEIVAYRSNFEAAFLGKYAKYSA